MMTTAGTILLADDEETFRESTSRLLEREGFACRCVEDAEQTIESLQHGRFDLLVTDIRMPRNTDLQMIQTARDLDSQLPVIVVTGYPSAETAIHALKMSVVAYLTKPVDFEELISYVRVAVDNSRNRRVLATVQRRLSACLLELDTTSVKRLPDGNQPDDLFSIATIRTLAACLSDLLDLARRTGMRPGSQNLCQWLDCSQEPKCLYAIGKTIEILKETKGAFKSKVLADLRKDLEGTIGSLECHPSEE